MGRHLSWGELNRLADGEPVGDSHGSAEHVASCPRCRERLAYLTDLSRAAREMRHPSPPRDLLEDVLESRIEGHRVILPTAPVDVRRRRRLPAVAAGIAIAATAGLATVFVTSEAGAGASDLRFDPPVPQRGESVRVEYRAGAALAGEPVLKLRVRTRASRDDELRGDLGGYREVELLPAGDGLYRATLHRLDATVYEQFAVEDVTGETVDDRAGRLWHLLSADPSGEPLPEALLQRFRVLEHRNWASAEETLVRLTTLYPERADAWSLKLAFERADGLPDETATLMATHREIFRDLQQRALDDATLEAGEAEALVRYASALDEDEAAAYWRSRLEELDPTNRLLVSSKVALALAGDDDGLSSALALLDELWTSGARGAVVYETGFSLANRSGEPGSVHTWARRVLQSTDEHDYVAEAALALVAHPETRPEGLAEVRRLLAHLEQPDESDRPLDRNRGEARADSRGLMRSLYVELGQELLISGEPEGALRELDQAEALQGWQPVLYRHRFDARLAAGDTTGALEDLARLQVDPIYATSSADSLLELLPGGHDSRLRQLRLVASGEMVRLTRADLPPQQVLPAVSVRAASGATPGIRELVSDRPTIIALWDRRLTDDEARSIRRASERLEGHDGQLLWITPEANSEALRSFARSERLTVPRYADDDGRLASTLGAWTSHRYYVVDSTGRIRYQTNDLTEAVRLLEILRLDSRATV